MLFFGRSTKQGYTQSQLVEILDEYQPSVSNLTRGKIAKVSVEKLLAYSDRLKMKTSLIVGAGSGAPAIATPEFVPVCRRVPAREIGHLGLVGEWRQLARSLRWSAGRVPNFGLAGSGGRMS